MAPGPPVPPGVTPELTHDMAGGHAQNPLEGMVALHKQMEGALLIRRDATLEHGARALAIVSPAQHMLQRDRVRLLVAQMASPEEAQAHGGLQVLMKEETLPVEGLKLKYTMLAPHLVTPDTERYPQGGMARVAVRSGTGPAVATCARYSIDNPQAITITVVSKAPNGTTQSSTFETTCVGFLQSIDIQATGARNFEDTMFRAIEGGPSIENIRVPGDEPGFFPEINIQILRPHPPGIAHGPTMVAPPPPAVAAGLFGGGPRPPPPPMGIPFDLSGNAEDPVPAAFVRKLLGNLSPFKHVQEAGWAAVPQQPVIAAIGTIISRLALKGPLATKAEADRYVIKANSTISLMFSERVLEAATNATEEAEERGEMLRSHSLIQRTPPSGMGMGPGAALPAAQQHARRAQGTKARAGGGGGAAGRSLGAAMGVIDVDQGMHSASGGDDSSDDDQHDASGRATNGQKPAKRSRKDPSDGDYPTLSMLCPTDSNVKEFAAIMQQEAANKSSATQAIVEALRISGVSTRMSWGDDPRDPAEAALAVAVDKIRQAGGDTPQRPNSREGIGRLVNTLMSKIHDLPVSTGASGMHAQSDGARDGRLLAAIASNRPVDETDRAFFRTAPVGPSVIHRLSAQPRANEGAAWDSANKRMQWEQAVRGAELGKVVQGPPNDVLRLMMADKSSRVDSETNLPAATREAIGQSLDARGRAAKKAIERALRAQVQPDLIKRIVLAITSISFTKMPSLKSIAEAATIVDSFGVSRKMGACHPSQAVAAIRAGLAAHWPEIDWAPFLWLEDDVRGLLLGKNEGGIAAEAASVRAGQLFEALTKHMAARADAFRLGTLFPANEAPSDLLGADEVQTALDVQHDSNMAAMGLLAAVTSNGSNVFAAYRNGAGGMGGGGGGGGGAGGAKLKLNALLQPWRQEFGSNACIFFWARQSGCNRGAQCDKMHEAAALNKTTIEEWIKRNNAETSEVSADGEPNGTLESAGLALAAQLYHESPSTGSVQPPPVEAKQGVAEIDASGDEGRATAVAEAIQLTTTSSEDEVQSIPGGEDAAGVAGAEEVRMEADGMGGGGGDSEAPSTQESWPSATSTEMDAAASELARVIASGALDGVEESIGIVASPKPPRPKPPSLYCEHPDFCDTTEECPNCGEYRQRCSKCRKPWCGWCRTWDSADRQEAAEGVSTDARAEGDAAHGEAEAGLLIGGGEVEKDEDGEEEEVEVEVVEMDDGNGHPAEGEEDEAGEEDYEGMPELLGPEETTEQVLTISEMRREIQQQSVPQPCQWCKRYPEIMSAGGVAPSGSPVCRTCDECSGQRCEWCETPGTPACTCPNRIERHQHAVNVLRTRPEGPALERAESSMRTTRGMPDEERAWPESPEQAKYMQVSSLDDRPYVTKAQPHRVERERQKVRDLGFDPDWRPEGDATTLYMPGKEYGLWEVSKWAKAAAQATLRMAANLDVKPPAELRQVTAEFLRPEAAANAPWYIAGEHFDKPIPLREAFPDRIDNDYGVDADYFKRRMEAGDPDQDICYQAASYGLDTLLEIKDTLLTFHLKAFYADEGMLEHGIKTVEEEIDESIILVHSPAKARGCNVAIVPTRQSPRFCVDEGFKDEEKTVRKLRSIVHYSHPAAINGVHKYPEMNPNASVNLEEEHVKLTMGSGKRHFRNAGILKTSEVEVVQVKRDGKNAFRQVRTAPVDGWATSLFWPTKLRVLAAKLKALIRNGAHVTSVEMLEIIDSVEVTHCTDGSIIMGLSSAMFSFQRLMEVPNRHVNILNRAFDIEHPATAWSLVEWLEDRRDRLGPVQGGRTEADDQYCDDSIRSFINDLVTLIRRVQSPTVTYEAGDKVKRGVAKMCFFDTVFETDLKMTMADNKKISTTGFMEALGVEGSLDLGIQRYPVRKRPELIETIREVLYGGSTLVPKDMVMTALHKELWMMQMAPEMAMMLSSGWALLAAKTNAPSGRVTLSTRFEEDQEAVIAMLKMPGTAQLPLIPCSYFPLLDSVAHMVGAQDASTSTGAGGWMLIEGDLHGFSVRWPMWLAAALREGRYSISPLELWALLANTIIPTRLRKREVHHYLTILTDNESARAAANRGRSHAATMHIIAQEVAGVASRDDMTMRTLRISTKENETADNMSREGGIEAGRALAKAMGVKFIEHEIAHDDPIWRLIVVVLEPPPSPTM